MNFLRIFNFIFILFYVGLCLPSASQSNSNSNPNYQQTREQIIARTMAELQIEEYGEIQVKQPVLVLEKNIEEIPEPNTLVEVHVPENNDVYIGQKIREQVITNTMSEMQSKEDWGHDSSVFVVEQSFDEQRSPLKPRFEANWRYSNDRSILMGEFWLPLVQCKEDSVLFCDIRIMGDDSENKEFNIGAGYREVLYDTILGDGIAGGMIWFDRRFTNRDAQFNQVTVGGEWLGEQYDLRMNGYFPIDKNKKYIQSNPNGTGVGFVGNQILVNTDQVVVEEVLPGIDFEVGSQLKFMNGITDSTRFFVGGYHFEGDYAEDITGVRTRIVSDITSDVQIGARFQHDDIRGSQTYVESTIRFPFGYKKKYKHEGYWSRLDESPERDIDVVSNEAVTDTGVNKVLLNATSGATQNVVHVDNTSAAGGNGTIEKPYNTLAAAESVATTNDMIYIHKGDGATTGQNAGINLNGSGQMLVGSGVDLLYSSDRFQTSSGMEVPGVIVAATTAPMISNGAGNGVDVSADDVLVSGVTVDGATGHGIYALNADNIIIDTVTSNNNASTGIRVDANAVTLSKATLKNSTTNTNGVNGIFAYAIGGGDIDTLDFINNTAVSNTGYGIYSEVTDLGSTMTTTNFRGNTAMNNSIYGLYARTLNDGDIEVVNFENNLSSNNTSYGIRVEANGAGSSMGITNLENNITNNNGASGLFVYALNSGSLGTSNFITNTSDGNVDYGLWAYALSDGDITTVNFTNNTATNSTSIGILAQTAGVGSAITTVNVTSNNANSNGGGGIRAQATGSSAITTANFTNNNTNLNTGIGLYLWTASGGDISSADLIKNTSNNNTRYGIRAEASGIGSSMTTTNFENNITNTNGEGGLFLYAQNSGNFGTVNFAKNISDGNTGIGLWAYSVSDGDISTVNLTNNTSTNSTSHGILAQTIGAGSTLSNANFTSNTANGNGNVGLYTQASSGAEITTVDYTSNVATNNANYGIRAESNGVGATITTASFTNNRADNSTGGGGLIAYALNNGIITNASFVNNTATGNTGSGYVVNTASGGDIGTAILTGNTSTNNTNYGFYGVSLNAGGTITTLNYTNNIADGNNRAGFLTYAFIDGDISNVDFTGNTSKNNTTYGLQLLAESAGSSVSTASFTNNTVENNTNIGIYVEAATDGDIGQLKLQGNVVKDNTSYGIRVDDNSAAGGIVADLGGGVLGSTGGNSVSDNTLQELWVDLDGGALKAENNWWGNAAGLTGAETLLEDASSVDTTPFLIVDPD